MKKWIAVLLAAGLVTTGCTTKEEATEPTEQTEQQQPAQTETNNGTELTKEQEESLWTLTTPFPVEVTDAKGKKTTQNLIGEQGRFGYVDVPFVAGKKNRYTWKFWDKKSQLPGKKLTIKAKHHDDVESQELLTAPIAGPLEGATAHLLTDLALPKAGKYRLDLFVDGKPYGGVIVEVK